MSPISGEELWKTFLQSGVPDSELQALGYDLFWVKPQPGPAGASAVTKLAQRLGIAPLHAYAAFNIEPGKAVLEQLADEYDRRVPWVAIIPYTQQYLTRVAERITIIRKAMADKAKKPEVKPAVPAAKPAPAAATKPPAAATKP